MISSFCRNAVVVMDICPLLAFETETFRKLFVDIPRDRE